MTDALIAAGPLETLVGRLRAHAEVHEYIANADKEQRQWMQDLYDAADAIERLNDARKMAAAQAEDDGLWFAATMVTEAHLQKALRELAAAIETPNDK